MPSSLERPPRPDVVPTVDPSSRIGRERLLGALVPGVAHDLNNALAALTGWAELLASMPEDRLLDHRERLRDVLGEARRCGRMVDDVLTFVQANGGARAPITDVIDTAVAVLAYDIRRADAEIAISIADGVPMPAMERGPLQSVLVALIRNALIAVAGMSDRTVTIEVESTHAGLSVAVVDRGPGFTSDQARAALDPPLFARRLEDGLGIASCADVLAEAGGAILIETGGAGARVVAHVPGA